MAPLFPGEESLAVLGSGGTGGVAVPGVFVFTTSLRWDDAVDNGLGTSAAGAGLAVDAAGFEPAFRLFESVAFLEAAVADLADVADEVDVLRCRSGTGIVSVGVKVVVG